MEDEYKVFAVDIQCVCSKRIYVRAKDEYDVESYLNDEADCRPGRYADIDELAVDDYCVDYFDIAGIEEADPGSYLLREIEYDLEEEEEEEE